MSVKAIREYDAKKILQMNWDKTKSDELGIKGMMVPPAVLDCTTGATWDKLLEENLRFRLSNLEILGAEGESSKVVSVPPTFSPPDPWRKHHTLCSRAASSSPDSVGMATGAASRTWPTPTSRVYCTPKY